MSTAGPGLDARMRVLLGSDPPGDARNGLETRKEL
jgi:hypothetical protein